MKFYLINTVAAFLILFLGVSVHAVLLNVTTLDVPGGNYTAAKGIDGSNIVGSYFVSSEEAYHGFLAVIPEPATLSLLAVGMLMACRRRRVSCSRVSQA